MNQRTAIITGAYGAIGKAIAMGLAQKGYYLTLAGRDKSKLEREADEISNKTGNRNIYIRSIDLSRKSEIEQFSQDWNKPLGLLINNAATAPGRRQTTPEGIELQFATNVLGYFWMTKYFHTLMAGSEDARIVNVASYWAGDLDLSDLEFVRRRYNNDTAYRQSKQANRMLTVAFAQNLSESNIAVLSCHPGDVNSKLSNSLGFGGSESPQQGAATPLYCATEPLLKGLTGKYFENRKQTYCPYSIEREAIRSLFEICDRY